jgi:hypothetical protein
VKEFSKKSIFNGETPPPQTSGVGETNLQNILVRKLGQKCIFDLAFKMGFTRLIAVGVRIPIKWTIFFFFHPCTCAK